MEMLCSLPCESRVKCLPAALKSFALLIHVVSVRHIQHSGASGHQFGK